MNDVRNKSPLIKSEEIKEEILPTSSDDYKPLSQELLGKQGR